MNSENKTLYELKSDIIKDSKKGSAFLYAGAMYWLVMGVLSFFMEDDHLLALCYLVGMGSVFPLAILISRLLQANLFSKNPLGELGGVTGGIQAFYLLIWIILYIENYQLLPVAIGVLGASHFLPYVWIYNSKTYGYFTIMMAAVSFVFGYIFIDQAFISLPFLLVAVYIIAVAGLALETKKLV